MSRIHVSGVTSDDDNYTRHKKNKQNLAGHHSEGENIDNDSEKDSEHCSVEARDKIVHPNEQPLLQNSNHPKHHKSSNRLYMNNDKFIRGYDSSQTLNSDDNRSLFS